MVSSTLTIYGYYVASSLISNESKAKAVFLFTTIH